MSFRLLFLTFIINVLYLYFLSSLVYDMRKGVHILEKYAVIFDLDGTLLNSPFGALDRFRAALSSLNIPISNEQNLAIVRDWENGKYELLVENWPEIPPSAIYDAWNVIDDKCTHPLYEHAETILDELITRGIPCMLATHRNARSVKRYVDHYDLYRRFVHIEAGWDCAEPKYSPEKIRDLRHALNRSRCSSAYMIGDSLSHDLRLANALGAEFIASGYGITPPEHFRNAGVPDTNIILDIREILSLLPL